MVIKGVLFDIDGVLITSWKALPDAVETLQCVRDLGYACNFLTNTTSKSARGIYESLQESGFSLEYSEITTAAQLTAEYVKEQYPNAVCWMLNQGDISEDFSGITYITEPPETIPDLVILGGAGAEVYTHHNLSLITEYILAGVPTIAMHRSLFWASNSAINVDTGFYLEGFQTISPKSIPIIGKPSLFSFALVCERMGCLPSELVMIGDDIRADVLASQASGLTGVLVKTGKFRQEILEATWHDDFGQIPDHVISHIGDLPSLLAALDQ